MNLLVTGGCGFIGSNFIRERLCHRQPAPEQSEIDRDVGTYVKSIINLDLLTYAGNPDNLADVCEDRRYVFVQGNIGDEPLVTDILETYEIDAVVNFAAESHVDRSIDSPEPFVQTNAVSTLRLLNAVRRYWRDLPPSKQGAFRLLHVSTDEVYGTLGPHDAPFTEKTPFAPNSPYAASKAASDHFVRAFRQTYGLPTLTTNCSNNYGPYHFPEKLIPLMILNALDGKPLPVYGDGGQIRDWLYVEDHVCAIWLVLRKGRPGETYNIGGSTEKTSLEIVRTICALLDRKAPRPDGMLYAAQITHVGDRPGHDRRYAIDCTKIRRELGWSPRESFATGIEKTVDWYLSNRSWAEEVTEKRYARERLGVSL
jgi:dTDP-glucose 4,6-dehydratase